MIDLSRGPLTIEHESYFESSQFVVLFKHSLLAKGNGSPDMVFPSFH